MTKRQTSKGKIAQPIDTVEKAKKILIQKLRECIDMLGTYTELVRENRNPEGGQTNTYIKMLEFQQEALRLLQVYPDSEYKDALILMVNYVIERKI